MHYLKSEVFLVRSKQLPEKQLTSSKILRFLLVLVILSIPFNEFSVFKIAGFSISPGLIALGLFIIFSSFKIRVRLTLPTIFILIYLFYCVILNMPALFIRNLSLLDFSRSFLLLSGFVIGYINLSNYEVSTKFIYHLLVLLILVSIPLMIYGLYQVPARKLNLPLAYIQSSLLSQTMRSDVLRSLGYSRIQSVFVEPAHYAAFLGILLCITFPFINLQNMRISKKGFLFILTLEIFSFVLTISLSSYLYLFITICIYFFINLFFKFKTTKRSFIKRVSYIFFSFLIAIMMLYLLNLCYKINIFDILLHRLGSVSSEGSYAARVLALKESFDITLHHVPLLGMGLGNTQNWLKLYYPNTHSISQGSYIINSGYGYLIASSGLIGFYLFILFIGASFYNICRSYLICIRKHMPIFIETIAKISLLLFIFLIVSMLFSGVFINLRLWTLLGLINLFNNAILKVAESKKRVELL